MNNIENVTKPAGDVNLDGTPKETTPETQPAPEGTEQVKTQEVASDELEAVKAERDTLKQTVDTLQKSVKGFQPELQREALNKKKLEKELAEAKAQLAEATSGDYESPNEGVLQAKLGAANKALVESNARVAAIKALQGRNLPETLKEKVLESPLTFIKPTDVSDPEVVALEIAEQLPSNLDKLEEELGGIKPKEDVSNAPDSTQEQAPKSPPVPTGAPSVARKTIYADEIDPNTVGGRSLGKELAPKIDSGEVAVLPSRKPRVRFSI